MVSRVNQMSWTKTILARKYCILALTIIGVPCCAIAIWILSTCVHNGRVHEQWREHVSGCDAISLQNNILSSTLVRFRDTTATVRTRKGESRHPYGYMDSEGRVVIPAKFPLAAKYFSQSLAWVETPDGQLGYIGPEGDLRFTVDSIGLYDFNDGLAKFAVKESRGQVAIGFIDDNGRVVVEPIYRSASKFQCGYALISDSTTIGSILERIVDETGIGVSVCFAYRKRIIDKNGQVVSALY